ncbi:S-4TM family putative pore-forming effector [Kosakonia sacchari]|uniref:S-4TM family putative pore-forming effector n=1 Tax=Kosakonia sacchari TaxID=1158459 RepID=UPI002ACEABC8|nr:S-4TM family putative pore-forming effector [Kosakonia sacchari]MDZ7320109.1 S-4TM family putative pore-forming effector [Kosakonia sacchari]
MNTIYTNQSTRENLDLLYAQATIYDRVKLWSRSNFVLSVILPVLLSVAAAYNRSKEVIDTELASSFLGLYGLVVLAFNIVLSHYASGLRRKAASVQEMYDCRVLGIRRNDLKVEEVPRDEISRAASYFKHRPERAERRFGKQGWYVSKVYDAPQPVMALLCHGKNLGWDRSLRQILHWVYLCAVIMFPAAILSYSVAMKSSLNEVLFYIVFILPLIRYFLLQFLDNLNSIKRSEKLKKYVEKELYNIKVSGRVDDEGLSYTLRNIQDEIFSYRASCPPAPNGIQRVMKFRNEQVYDDYFESNLQELHLPD